MVTEQHAAGALDGSVDPEELTTLLAQENQALLVTLAQLKAENSALKATQPASAEPVAWMIDWPDEPELGHYFSESPDELKGSRSRPLFTAAPPAAARGDGRSDADYAIEHGRYLANDADKFMKALNDAFDPETEETDLHDESISEARDRLASSVYEFRKRADRAMRTKGAAAHGDEAVRKDAERLDFILTKARKVVVDCISSGRFDVYVEEGIMGDVAYPGVRREFTPGVGSTQELAVMREAIDAAMRAQGDDKKEVL